MGRESMLKIIEENQKKSQHAKEESAMKRAYERMMADNSSQQNTGDDYMSLVDKYMEDHPDVSKAEAYRQITRKYPQKHTEWIRKINDLS